MRPPNAATLPPPNAPHLIAALRVIPAIQAAKEADRLAMWYEGTKVVSKVKSWLIAKSLSFAGLSLNSL